MPAAVSALKSVLLPTFGNPTMPASMIPAQTSLSAVHNGTRKYNHLAEPYKESPPNRPGGVNCGLPECRGKNGDWRGFTHEPLVFRVAAYFQTRNNAALPTARPEQPF